MRYSTAELRHQPTLVNADPKTLGVRIVFMCCLAALKQFYECDTGRDNADSITAPIPYTPKKPNSNIFENVVFPNIQVRIHSNDAIFRMSKFEYSDSNENHSNTYPHPPNKAKFLPYL